MVHIAHVESCSLGTKAQNTSRNPTAVHTHILGEISQESSHVREKLHKTTDPLH
jgi:hypothetical protein